MALEVNSLEGNEIADDYIRSSIPKGRWGEAWGVFKSNFVKLILLNVFVLITVVPALAVLYFRTAYISSLVSILPTPGSLADWHPDVAGLEERIQLSADLLFYSVLVVSGFIASIGISGAVYTIKRLLHTSGQFSLKSFFHGIKVCYFNTVLPLTVFLLFLFASKLVGDWKDVLVATGGNKAGAITAQVFIILATVFVGIYCGWVFAVGVSYRVKFKQLFKNAFVLMIGTPFQTLLMAGFTLIPVWLFMIGGFIRTLSYIIFILMGFSFILLSWSAFTHWAFDLYVTPNLKAAAEEVRASKSEKELALEKEEEDKKAARELLAAGKSELIARPIMPIAESGSVKTLGMTFTRADVAGCAQGRNQIGAAVAAYEEEHKNDPVYLEYNKLFAEREKALQSDGKKGKKNKKISAKNLLK